MKPWTRKPPASCGSPRRDRLRRMTFYCHSSAACGGCCGISGKKGPENCGNCSVCLGLYQQESPACAPAAPLGLARPKPNRKALAQAQLTDSQRNFSSGCGPCGLPWPAGRGARLCDLHRQDPSGTGGGSTPAPAAGRDQWGGRTQGRRLRGRILAEIRSFLRQEGEL